MTGGSLSANHMSTIEVEKLAWKNLQHEGFRPWWPIGYGEQSRYCVQAQLVLAVRFALKFSLWLTSLNRFLELMMLD